MTLTPVRVRGKRRTPSRMPPTASSASGHQVQQQGPPSSKKPKRSLETVMAARTSRHRSNIDTLPSEILEQILLYSANVALPHASHAIGIRLSERATLIRFFIWAFHDTWEQWFGVPTSKTLQHGPPILGQHKKKCQGDPVLQVRTTSTST